LHEERRRSAIESMRRVSVAQPMRSESVTTSMWMFFEKRDGKCFAFIKLGPMAGRAGEGHLFTILGFFCKARGQPLETNAAASMINAVQLKTY
jgi:hypothetical protein